ncbi:hypothetical protein HDU98_009662 [Podochytrium sp. JEL0797]|nr:hypothetical protein HDU98_009662 [Podochytrium sp. JEL0797]
MSAFLESLLDTVVYPTQAQRVQYSSPRPHQALPSGWIAQWSQQFDSFFYANERTGQAQWTRPSGSQSVRYHKNGTPSQHEHKKALIIGINYAGGKYALTDCINDAINITQMLTHQYGFGSDEESLLVLVDDANDSRRLPTVKNLLSAFNWLVCNAKPGDELVLSYSGDKASSRVAQDTICPIDFATNGMIDSDLLHKVLASAMPKGCKLSVILNCDHSSVRPKIERLAQLGTAREVTTTYDFLDSLLSTVVHPEDAPHPHKQRIEQPHPPLEELPPGWVASWSQDFNCYFYANKKTGQTQWTPPPAAPQQTKLDGSKPNQLLQKLQQKPAGNTLAATQPASGRKKALLIGINYTGSEHALKGCINDAHNIKQMLSQQFGYKTDQQSMLMLVDDARDPQHIPTVKNMLGHGSQIQDQDGDRANGLDDTICPVDFATEGMIDSDMLHKVLVKAMPQGCKLTVIMDCCHSGTMLELPYTYRPDLDGKMSRKELLQAGKAVVLQAQRLLKGGFSAAKKHEAQVLKDEVMSLARVFAGTASVNNASEYKLESFNENSEAPKECYLISGCLDEQTSADAQLNGMASGALTFALLSALRDNPKGISFEDLLAQLRVFMKEDGFSQIPQLSCGTPVDPDSPFVL